MPIQPNNCKIEPEPEEPKWDADDPLIIEQPSTWIFWGGKGHLVIRQRGEVFEDDPCVMFTVENLPALIAGLRCKLAEAAAAQNEPEPEPQTKAEQVNRPPTNGGRAAKAATQKTSRRESRESRET